MNIRPIKTKTDYQNALKRLDVIFDSKPGTKEGDELEILSLLIDHYEREHYPIDAPDPIEAIKFRMDQMGYKQKDLEDALGYKSRISEILNRKRKLTVDMIRKLHSVLNIPLDSLIKEYKLTG
jgi:HTH-type transcriptional regulator/antitoxin HigA